jgi:hypothetical protein
MSSNASLFIYLDFVRLRILSGFGELNVFSSSREAAASNGMVVN